jgi:hypothetical protein
MHAMKFLDEISKEEGKSPCGQTRLLFKDMLSILSTICVGNSPQKTLWGEAKQKKNPGA